MVEFGFKVLYASVQQWRPIDDDDGIVMKIRIVTASIATTDSGKSLES